MKKQESNSDLDFLDNLDNIENIQTTIVRKKEKQKEMNQGWIDLLLAYSEVESRILNN